MIRGWANFWNEIFHQRIFTLNLNLRDLIKRLLSKFCLQFRFHSFVMIINALLIPLFNPRHQVLLDAIDSSAPVMISLCLGAKIAEAGILTVADQAKVAE